MTANRRRLVPERFPAWWVVAGGCAVTAVLGLVNVVASSTTVVDRRAQTALFAQRNTVLRTTTQRLTVAGAAPVVIGAGVVIALLVWLRARDRVVAAWYAAAAPLALAAEVAVKNVVRRGPPAEKVQYAEPVNSWFADLFQPGKYSFPSGHATLSAALATVLALLAWQRLEGWQRVAALSACAAFAILIAVSRVVLGVHFLSDVVAGLALGTAIGVAGSRSADRLRGYRSP